MAKYLLDVNIPYYFSMWKYEDYIHQIIVTHWQHILELNKEYKLVNVFETRLEGVN